MDGTKISPFTAGLILTLTIGTLVWSQKQAALINPPGVQPGEAVGVSVAELARHNTRESCWTSINGNIYDLTGWIPKHPGGERAILGLCGIDGSESFNKKHGSSEQALAALAGFKINVLAP